MQGTIKRLVRDRGFGFIRGPQGEEYFFHRSGLQVPEIFNTLQEGQVVTFEMEASIKGPRATHVEGV